MKDSLDSLEIKISKLVSKDNRDKLYENFQKLDQTEGENFSHGLWTIKNKEFPKITSSFPAAKVDANGRRVTDPNGIKDLYLDTFCHRMRHRPIKDENAELFELQKELCEKRL